jgi:hypothetical protein
VTKREHLVISDPKRNKWIVHQVKRDPIDAEKLAQLAVDIKEIHHPLGQRRFGIMTAIMINKKVRIKNKIKAKFLQMEFNVQAKLHQTNNGRNAKIALEPALLVIIDSLWRN